MKLKIRKDNKKENICYIDKYEVYNTSVGFLDLSGLNLGFSLS